MKQLAAAVALIVLFAVSTFAAESRILSFQPAGPEVIEPGEAIRLTWLYDEAANAARPVQFRLYLDSIVVRNFASSDLDVTTTAGVRTYTTKAGVVAPFTVAQVGTNHTYSLSVYDATGESLPSATTLAVTIKWLSNAPPPPTGFKRFKLPVGGDDVDFNPKTGELRLYLKPVGGA